LSAVKAGRVVRIAGPVILCDERIGAQRACSPGEGLPAGDNRSRRLVFFNPCLDCTKGVKIIEPRASAAMVHAGDEKEARKIMGSWLSAVVLLYLLVIANEVKRGKDRIALARVKEKLPLTLAEGRPVGGGRVDFRRCLFDAGRIAVEVELENIDTRRCARHGESIKEGRKD
jgi:hypothetical protein